MALSFLPAQLLTKTGLRATSEVLSGKKAVALYFSAHWCPPCRGFTPVAGDFYKSLASSDAAALEVIFVSSDSDEESFKEYYASMPWVSVAFDDESTRSALGSKFGVRGIPAFIVVDPITGEVVDKDGRATVTTNKDSPAGAMSKWAK